MTRKKTSTRKKPLTDLKTDQGKTDKDPKTDLPPTEKKENGKPQTVSLTEGDKGIPGQPDRVAAGRMKEVQGPTAAPVPVVISFDKDPDPFWRFIYRGISDLAAKIKARWRMDPDEIRDLAISTDAVMTKYFPQIAEKSPEIALAESVGRYVAARVDFKQKEKPKAAPAAEVKEKKDQADPAPAGLSLSELERMEREARENAEKK